MIYHRTIRLADTDAAGVVYFAHVLSICHEAYEYALESQGLSLQEWLEKKEIALPIVHSEIDFFRPLYWGDKLMIELSSQCLTENTFEMTYQLESNRYPHQTIVTAKTRHICINSQTRQKITFPPALQKWL